MPCPVTRQGAAYTRTHNCLYVAGASQTLAAAGHLPPGEQTTFQYSLPNRIALAQPQRVASSPGGSERTTDETSSDLWQDPARTDK